VLPCTCGLSDGEDRWRPCPVLVRAGVVIDIDRASVTMSNPIVALRSRTGKRQREQVIVR
jgi:fumarylacetoacetate (FAA) hydrolase family protein